MKHSAGQVCHPFTLHEFSILDGLPVRVSPFSLAKVLLGSPSPFISAFPSLPLRAHFLILRCSLRFPKRKIYLLPVSNRKQPLAPSAKRKRQGKLCPFPFLSRPIFHKSALDKRPSFSFCPQVRHEALLPHARQLRRLRRPLPRHAQVRRGALRLQEQGGRLHHQEAAAALVPRVGRGRHLEAEQEQAATSRGDGAAHGLLLVLDLDFIIDKVNTDQPTMVEYLICTYF